MVALDVPEAEYAVFSVPEADNPGALNANIQSTMKQIFADWLDTSSYTLTHEGILFEYYMGKDTFIYVPVVKK
jgi:predicted transcriptional regulator YdeE